MGRKNGQEKSTAMRIIILAVAGIMIAGAVLLPFLR
jgi:hypothetical protein